MNTLVIIQANSTYLNQLQQISIQTFRETFSAVNTTENMEKYISEKLSLSQLATELKDENALFYFIKSTNEVIGYLKLNMGASQTELKDDCALEIERIYVLKKFHGKNIGAQLLEKAIQVAKELDKNFIWLGVWENNQRAIQFYTKNRFVVFDKHLFTLGEDVQTDLMMKLPLKPQLKSIRPFIGAKDFACSSQFYKDWGFNELVLTPHLSLFQMGDFAFYLQDAYVKDWIDNTMVFLEVDNINAHLESITKLNLPIKYPGVRISAIQQLHWGKEYFIHDPSGILWHIGTFNN